jgi:uncharacterized cupin superfamily protein
MNITRFAAAPAYFPANHEGMRCLRLQGHEAGPADSIWLGISEIEPGGRTDLKASGVEKHYVVIEGELTVVAQGAGQSPEEEILGPLDSCRIAPGEARQLVNRSAAPVRVLLAMPFA